MYHQIARERTILEKAKSKTRFVQIFKPQKNNFEINDFVSIKESQIKNKFSNKSNSPFQILRLFGNKHNDAQLN